MSFLVEITDEGSSIVMQQDAVSTWIQRFEPAGSGGPSLYLAKIPDGTVIWTSPSGLSRCHERVTTHPKLIAQTPVDGYSPRRTYAAEYRRSGPRFTVDSRTPVNVDNPPQPGRSCLRSRRPQVRILPGAQR